MSGMQVADVVPNAIELQPLVTDSPYGSKIASDGSGNGNGHRPAIAPEHHERGLPAVAADDAAMRRSSPAAPRLTARRRRARARRVLPPRRLALTRRLADALGLRGGDRVGDIASGPGATSCLLATEYDVR